MMPRVTVSQDGTPLTEVTLFKDRTTLGRRPYNDIVLNHLTVSGEHAVLHMTGSQVFIEDLQSTNGTRLNAQALTQREKLSDSDVIEIGKYALQYWSDEDATPSKPSKIKVLSGSATGREMALTKAITTIGKPGVAVAAITRQNQGYVVHHVEGDDAPTLNGQPIGVQPVALKNGDVIALAGTQMQFMHA